MFCAKMSDEEDDELPGFDEEEKGQEQPSEPIEVEEIIVEEEPEEEKNRGTCGPRSPEVRAQAESEEGQEGSSEKESEEQTESEGKSNKGAAEEEQAEETLGQRFFRGIRIAGPCDG